MSFDKLLAYKKKVTALMHANLWKLNWDLFLYLDRNI